MGYRILQVAACLLGIVFAVAACTAIKEPWATMDSIMTAQVAAGYLIAVVLAVVCAVAARHFGVKAREISD